MDSPTLEQIWDGLEPTQPMPICRWSSVRQRMLAIVRDEMLLAYMAGYREYQPSTAPIVRDCRASTWGKDLQSEYLRGWGDKAADRIAGEPIEPRLT